MTGEMTMARPASLLLLLLLAACARSEDASIVANSNDVQSIEAVRTADEDEEEVALGDWRETFQDEHGALEFGPAGTPPLFSLRCDERRSVFLQRHGTPLSGDLPIMLVTVGSDTRRLAVTNVGGAVPMIRASLAPSDELIRVLSSANVPIVIRLGDAVPLVLPPGPAIGAFLGRCASGAGGAPVPEVSANAAAPASAPAANQAEPAPPAPARR